MGIKYEKESLMQFIVAQECSCPYCNSKFENKELLSKHIDRIHSGSEFLALPPLCKTSAFVL